jgi:hypothetical protein
MANHHDKNMRYTFELSREDVETIRDALRIAHKKYFTRFADIRIGSKNYVERSAVALQCAARCNYLLLDKIKC